MDAGKLIVYTGSKEGSANSSLALKMETVMFLQNAGIYL
jgi:hypothetical protein